MTHFNAETLELVTDDELAEQYNRYLDEVQHPYGITIDGVELVPSETLLEGDPVAYEDNVNTYINSLYDAGELTSLWDRDERIKELCSDWAFDVLGEVLDHTTTIEDEVIYNALFELYKSGVLELDAGEIQLSSQHTMSEVLISIGAELKENNN